MGSLDSEKRHRRGDQVVAASPASISTSSITSVATELGDSRQPTPIDEDIKDPASIEFSVGDALKGARGKVAPPLIFSSRPRQALSLRQREKKGGYCKEQMRISVDYIHDVMNCLQQVSDCLSTNNHDINPCRAALPLIIGIMQHRCKDIIMRYK